MFEKNETRWYKNVIDGREKQLTDNQIKRLFFVHHEGRRIEKGGWVLMPDPPKSEEAVKISEETKNVRRGKANK